MHPNSLKNLIQFNEMDKERHKELSRKGGIESGRKRLLNKYMNERINLFMHILEVAEQRGISPDVVCNSLIDWNEIDYIDDRIKEILKIK